MDIPFLQSIKFYIIFIIGFVLNACNKPYISKSSVTINEDSISLYAPTQFTIINDSNFVLINDRKSIVKYNINTGKSIKIFSIDTDQFREIVLKEMKYLPKRDYELILDKRVAKEVYNENLNEIYSFDIDNENFYIYSSFLVPYHGKYKDVDAFWMNKIYTIITTDKSFRIRRVQLFNYYFDTVNPDYTDGFKIYKNRLYTFNYVILNKNKIEKNYPAISYFDWDIKNDSILSIPNTIDGIFFSRNSFVNSNNNLIEDGKLHETEKGLYACLNNKIVNVENSKVVLSILPDFKIKDFFLEDESLIYYVSQKNNSKDIFVNLYKSGKNVFKKQISKFFDIKGISIMKNRFYFLTKDSINYYLKTYTINE